MASRTGWIMMLSNLMDTPAKQLVWLVTNLVTNY